MHTTEKDVLFLNTLNVCLTPTPQEGLFHMLFVRKQLTQETMEPEDWDCYHLSSTVAVPTNVATKITFAFAFTCIVVFGFNHFSHSVSPSFLSQHVTMSSSNLIEAQRRRAIITMNSLITVTILVFLIQAA